MEKIIEELREKLNELINEKKNLLDSEVVTASKMLDSALNTYCEVLKQNKE
ncbi:aspartyl-phosphate phosphatase Spo0E family protein [Clostridium muellerianum]|nr:aspartyl-phosphate phosphatase Spo0E family protein [Clostridium muellerianum]